MRKSKITSAVLGTHLWPSSVWYCMKYIAETILSNTYCTLLYFIIFAVYMTTSCSTHYKNIRDDNSIRVTWQGAFPFGSGGSRICRVKIYVPDLRTVCGGTEAFYMSTTTTELKYYLDNDVYAYKVDMTVWFFSILRHIPSWRIAVVTFSDWKFSGIASS